MPLLTESEKGKEHNEHLTLHPDRNFRAREDVVHVESARKQSIIDTYYRNGRDIGQVQETAMSTRDDGRYESIDIMKRER